jgi:phenylpropionate dioxygenase-like ring-hydroxylating dioxygenase large terminal subunit
MAESRPVVLDESLAFDEENIEILPNAWYSDPTAFRLEQDEIIARTWQYAGPAGMVEKPNQFVTTQLGSLPVVVTRDKDGELHAMANVCQHRGSIIADGHGYCQKLKCPYHGWTYGLDGALERPMGMAEEVDHAEFSLTRLAATTWGPFLFVGPADMASIDNFLDPLPGRLKDTGLEWDDLHLRDSRSYEIEANWKIVTENYIECYHCGHVHPDYSKYVDMDTYSWEYGNFYEAQAGPAHPAAIRDGWLREDDLIKDGLFVHTWPNFHIQIYPGDAHNLSALLIRPVSPTKTVAVLEHYYGPESSEGEAARITEMFDQQLREDWVICERVQRGLQSGAYRAGRMSFDDYRAGRLNLAADAGKTEEPLRHFHRLLHKALHEGRDLRFGANGAGRNGRGARGNGR